MRFETDVANYLVGQELLHLLDGEIVKFGDKNGFMIKKNSFLLQKQNRRICYEYKNETYK